jgi:ATP-dependent Lon protease
LDVSFDLSKVFFIATANSLDSIPGPLLDRMEIVDLSGYTTAEKLHIAKRHLVPQELEAHGLTPSQLVRPDETLLKVIHAYTREAGVRDLKRKLATLCRAMAEKVLAPEAVLPLTFELDALEEVLGGERYVHEVAERISPPGVVTGLAWTPQGGEILFIEANLMPGKGGLTLTGQLGDVMKESAQIALSLVRSRLAPVIPGFQFDQMDLHLHVPAGAIPKDGPSAGVTMLTTIASVLTGRSVDPKLAMTGEITLRGAVMPVGGIKEKVIAAHRSGIERIILSKRNQKDLKEVPEEVRSALKFEFVETASEVLRLALGLEVQGVEETGLPTASLGTGTLYNGGHGPIAS